MTIKRFGKYNAKPTWFGGRRYASKAEAEYANILTILVANQIISDLVAQPVVKLTKYVSYHPDFRYVQKNDGECIPIDDISNLQSLTKRVISAIVYIDVKGFQTPEFKIKMNLWREFGPPGELRIVKKIGRKFVTVEVIENQR